MLGKDTRYDPIEALWQQVTVPPIDRATGVRAAKRIAREFGKLQDCSPNVKHRLNYRGGKGRRCWISKTGGYNIQKGWARLAHDLSHMIYRRRHCGAFRPHGGGHARLEREIVQYIIGTLL